MNSNKKSDRNRNRLLSPLNNDKTIGLSGCGSMSAKLKARHFLFLLQILHIPFSHFSSQSQDLYKYFLFQPYIILVEFLFCLSSYATSSGTMSVMILMLMAAKNVVLKTTIEIVLSYHVSIRNICS